MQDSVDYPDCVNCAVTVEVVYLKGSTIVYWCRNCGQSTKVKHGKLLPATGDR